MRKRLLIVGCVTLVASACGGGASDAEGYAMDACGIEVSASGVATYDAVWEDTAKAWEETSENVEMWRTRAAAASSAAASNATYAALRDGTMAVYQTKNDAVSSWERAKPSLERFMAYFPQASIDKHNDGMDVVRIECTALASRLNAN